MAVQIVGQNASYVANVDVNNNLWVAASPNAISSVAAAWTSATLLDTAQVLLAAGGFPAIVVQLNQTSTITGGAVTFEGTYDGIDWQPLPASFVLDPQAFTQSANPYTLAANTNHAVLLLAGGFQQVRVRLNPQISGTGSVTVYWTLQSSNPLSAVSGTVSVTGQTYTTIGSPPVSALNVYATGGNVAVTGTVAATQSGTWNIGSISILPNVTIGAWVAGTLPVSNPALSELSFTAYGSPPTENLNVYVVNPVTATFTETQIGVTQGTSPWVVSGPDAVGVAPTKNPILISAVDPGGKIRNLASDFDGDQYVLPGGEASDAFGRFRTANPQTLFEAQFQYDTNPVLFVTSTSGTGFVARTPVATGSVTSATVASSTSATLSVAVTTGFVAGTQCLVSGLTTGNNTQLNGTWLIASIVPSTSITITGSGWTPHGASADSGTISQQSESSLTLSTGGTASGATAINQTKSYFRYEPGKSQYILMTGLVGAQKTNVRSRIGYFDANDGVYFEMDGTAGASVNVRSSATGTPTNTSITQANWNLDKMNGTGASGVTIDFSKTQIFVTDLQWLGVGRVRFGFYTGGNLVYCHQVLNDNSTTVPYMNTPNLPARAEITNTGTAATATTMKQICVSIMSEAGEDVPQSYQFAAANGVTAVTAGSGTRTPLISVQPKTTFDSVTNRSLIEAKSIEVFIIGATSVYWELVYNGTLSGASFASVNAGSAVNSDVSATACSGGTVLASGYAGGGAGSSKSGIEESVTKNTPFTLDFAGTTPDTLTLCASGIAGTAQSYGSILWTEVR